MPSVNDQIVSAVNVANTTTLAQGPALSLDLTSLTMADSIGIEMQNSVTTQHNAQIIGVAATTQVCALIIAAGAAGATK